MHTAASVRSMLSPATRRARLLAWKGIDLVVDVGANEGQYATRLRHAGFDGRIVSFEPGSDAFSRLSDHAASILPGPVTGWLWLTATARQP